MTRRVPWYFVGLAAVVTVLLATQGSSAQAPAVATVALPDPGAPKELFAGCNLISVTFPDGTTSEEVIDAVTPAETVQALWRQTPALDRFEGFSPQFPQASDLLTVNFLDAVWFCMTAAPSTTLPPPPTTTPASACVSAPAIYHNEQFGFEFQYCSECTLTEQLEGAHGLGGDDAHLSVIVGSRLELHVSDLGGLSLADYVSQVTDQLEARGASIDSVMQGAPVDGAEAVIVQYRSGGLGGYGEATFFERDGRVYDVGFTAGAFACNEPQVYTQTLSTFRFAA